MGKFIKIFLKIKIDNRSYLMECANYIIGKKIIYVSQTRTLIPKAVLKVSNQIVFF